MAIRDTPLGQIDALNSVAGVAGAPDSLTDTPDPVAEADAKIGQMRAEELMTKQQEALAAQLAAQNQPVVSEGRVNFADEDEYMEYAHGGGSTEGNRLIDAAKRYLGTPYVWGGSSALGMDCSGFVQKVYGQMGVTLPHSSVAMSRMGQAVSNSDLQVGDLVFVDASSRNGTGADHVGIYIGNGQVIESTRGKKNGVQITQIGRGSWARNFWARRVSGPASYGRPTNRGMF